MIRPSNAREGNKKYVAIVLVLGEAMEVTEDRLRQHFLEIPFASHELCQPVRQMALHQHIIGHKKLKRTFTFQVLHPQARHTDSSEVPCDTGLGIDSGMRNRYDPSLQMWLAEQVLLIVRWI